MSISPLPDVLDSARLVGVSLPRTLDHSVDILMILKYRRIDARLVIFISIKCPLRGLGSCRHIFEGSGVGLLSRLEKPQSAVSSEPPGHVTDRFTVREFQ